MRKKRVLLVKPWAESSFIEQDVNILKEHFELTEVIFSLKKAATIMRFLSDRDSDYVIIWFVFWWAFPIVLISRLCRVKTILIPSGVDIANYPQIEYGELRNPVHRIFVRLALNGADLLLPVSNFMRDEVLKVSKPKQIKVIYNGIDVRKFKRVAANEPKHNIVLTVGAVNQMNLKYKGFDFFVECARYIPESKFVLVGALLDDTITVLRRRAPPNVCFTGFLSENDLVQYYSRARVYVQFSFKEAFGCALAEAMSCECVPVVVKKGALPEVVGDVGFFTLNDNPEAAAMVVRMALSSDRGGEARERISALFSLEKRETELLNALSQMPPKNSAKRLATKKYMKQSSRLI